MTTSQLTFQNARAADRPPRIAGANERALALEHAHDVARASDETESPEKFALRQRVAELLVEFVNMCGPYKSFQASDFQNWMHETGQTPAGFDMRATGWMFKKLEKRGATECRGIRNNGGCRHTNAHAAPRAYYRWRRRATVEDLL